MPPVANVQLWRPKCIRNQEEQNNSQSDGGDSPSSVLSSCHFDRLNHWPRKVSTPASARHAMTMGSQNSNPVLPFSARLLRDMFGVHTTTFATSFNVLSWAGDSSSRL